MNKIVSLFLLLSVSLSQGFSQYQFTPVKDINCTEIKNQQRTGTCWSFATTSFIEAELIRQGYENVDLSEMFVVRNIYEDKAKNYILRQGKANFSQGSLSHDLLRMLEKEGVVPEMYYTGKVQGDKIHNHSEMEKGLKGFLDGVRQNKTLSLKWDYAVNAILDTYMGQEPTKFEVDGKYFTPKEYASHLNINADDYINLTSFIHHPMYKPFILEIPDNYSNGSFYNIPIDELLEIIDYSINNGYSVAWDGDVSEKGFSSKNGIAIMVDTEEDLDFSQYHKEMEVSQELRQTFFEQYVTTDDHLMHIVGIAKDQKGNKYYKIKNSWGEISDYKGFLYMSEKYAYMKTVAILVHKDAIPKTIFAKLKQ